MTVRVCVVTGGHLATCPRLLKAADALDEAGYRVRVVSTRHVPWATAADADLRRARRWSWSWNEVRFEPGSANRIRSGLRHRAARFAARAVGVDRCPLPVAARAFGRFHAEVLREAVSQPADFFYGGSGNMLAAVAEAARRQGVPYALDLEDFHSGEGDDSEAGRFSNAIAARVEGAVLPGAAFLTAGSGAIGDAYAAAYRVAPLAIHNVFPLPAVAPSLAPSDGNGLRLCWFSQTIGPDRGLEEAVRAMGAANLDGELTLRGGAIAGYVESLQRLAASRAPRLRVIGAPPTAPDRMVESCIGFDVGLALEVGHVRNRDLCLTNKALTYPLAGVAVAFTDTTGQRDVADDLGDGAFRFRPGDVATFAAGLRRWADDRARLARAKAAAWEAARRRWHWEHPSERGALLDAVARAVA